MRNLLGMPNYRHDTILPLAARGLGGAGNHMPETIELGLHGLTELILYTNDAYIEWLAHIAILELQGARVVHPDTGAMH